MLPPGFQRVVRQPRVFCRLCSFAQKRLEPRHNAEHLYALRARCRTHSRSALHILLVTDLPVPAEHARTGGIVLAHALAHRIFHIRLGFARKTDVAAHFYVMPHLAQEELIIPAPVAPRAARSTHIRYRAAFKHVFHLRAEAVAHAVKVSEPFFVRRVFHVPHRRPVVERFDPAVRPQPCVFYVVERVRERFVQHFIRRIQYGAFSEPDVMLPDFLQFISRIFCGRGQCFFLASGERSGQIYFFSAYTAYGVRSTIRPVFCAFDADNIECSLYSGYDPAAVTRAPEQHGGIVKNLSAAAGGGGNVLPPESLVRRKVHKRETFSAEFKPERAAGAVKDADHSASQMFLHRIFERGFVAPDKQRAKFDIVFASVR